jgi:hypothetical protein
MSFSQPTGFRGLQSLFSEMPIKLIGRVAEVLKQAEAPALSVMEEHTPYDTGALLGTLGSQVTEDTLIVFEDKDYGVYQNLGFEHWRNGFIEGTHMTDYTDAEITPVLLAEINLVITQSIQEAMSKG